ncbi:MAG: hypothetical protein ACYC9O_02530 [Candidatus Latescibacterota bacterium]
MRRSRVLLTAVAAIALFALGMGVALAQGTDKPVTVATILKAAGSPLTAEQATKIKDLDTTQGFQAFRAINEMFTEQQTAALKKELGTQPGRNNGPERPRYLTQVIVFEKAQCPVTEKQLAALKALPNEQGSREKQNEIFTDKQREAMQKFFPRRQ